MAEGFISFQIPIGRVWESLDMAIQEEELRSGAVEVGMGIAFAGDGGDAAIVEEPDER